MTAEVYRIRVPNRVISHIEGSSAAAPGPEPVRPGSNLAHRVAVWRKIQEAPLRADRSRSVMLTAAEVEALQGDAEILGIGARDNTNGWGEDGADARADLNAARAVLRACAKALGTRELYV